MHQVHLWETQDFAVTNLKSTLGKVTFATSNSRNFATIGSYMASDSGNSSRAWARWYEEILKSRHEIAAFSEGILKTCFFASPPVSGTAVGPYATNKENLKKNGCP